MSDLQPWHMRGACRGGSVCGPCRNSVAFRQSVLDAGLINERDFACPWNANPPSLNNGPGTKLARILKRCGFRDVASCQCRAMVTRMNAWGAERCREHIEEILAVMRQSAANREANPWGWPFVENVARRMILHVCSGCGPRFTSSSSL